MRYISLSSCSSSGEANTRLGGRGGGLRRCFVIQIFNHYLFDTLKKREKMNKIKKTFRSVPLESGKSVVICKISFRGEIYSATFF